MFYFCSQTIVAIDQVGGDDGFGEVPVDTAKLAAENAAIAVVMGNSNGTVEKVLITYSAQDNAVYVTFMNGSDVIDKVAVVNGKAAITATVPTFAEAAGTNYAATKYTFVEWVDAEGNAVTSETPISANTTVYAKFDTGIVYGDATGDGQVKGLDRTYIHQFVANSKVMGKTNVPVSSLTEIVIGAGDATGDGQVKGLDRTYVHQFVANSKVMGKTNTKIYVINK